ncbi:MAG: class I SAM-dependent methyltransferase [Bdellovibrionales bacterium]
MVSIRLHASAHEKRQDLSQLLKTFDLEVSDDAPYELGLESSWWVRDAEGRRLQIDFDANRKDYWRTHRGRGEPLARALGIKDSIRKVIDLTAGLGIDAVFMARLGFQVTAIERNPLVAFLLSEARKNAERRDLEHLDFVFASAQSFLEKLQLQEPTSAYFDPMYPESKKSALPRQEMRLFRDLVGDDTDSRSLLLRVLEIPFSRVVVKRPVRALPLVEKPAYQLEGKLVRYDVYYPKGAP